ncbi:MAG: MgtC/SapB family protein [Brumimicrobium sp.]|nr:MgtC/SapB family protein [Brumimicrobium sp.]
MDYNDLITLGISLGLGLLVGLQRERTNHVLAGVRTFTLISILGTLAGLITREFSTPFLLPVFAICLTGFLVVGNILNKKKSDEREIGQTTEVAALLMFAIGAYLVIGNWIIGIVAGGLMAILLYAKKRLHGFIENLKDKDLSAIMTFAGISLVILPILPDKTFGPLDVLNPQHIWLMVTFIVGISVVGYFIYKFLGKDMGLPANTILGGLISSTATTVSYARKTKGNQSLFMLSAFVITGASAVSFIRVIIEISVVAPEIVKSTFLPILTTFGIISALSFLIYYRLRNNKTSQDLPEPKNPAQLKIALIFGFFYALILLAVAFVKQEFGNDALYAVSAVSGLTNVDAITLSVSQIIKEGDISTSTGWRVILLAILSNLFFKGILTLILGPKKLAKWIIGTFGITILSGLAIIWLWP